MEQSRPSMTPSRTSETDYDIVERIFGKYYRKALEASEGRHVTPPPQPRQVEWNYDPYEEIA